MNPDTPDEQLALRAQHGDTEAFGELVERFEPKLLRYGRKFLSGREDIEDITQEVFIKAYQNIQEFDVTRRFSPWIYRIAHNAFTNALRARSRNPVRFFGFEFDTFVPHASEAVTQETEYEQHEIRALIERGLSQISPAYAEVLILYYLEELRYEQIAEVLRVPVGTVGVRLQRARIALKHNAHELQTLL